MENRQTLGSGVELGSWNKINVEHACDFMGAPLQSGEGFNPGNALQGTEGARMCKRKAGLQNFKNILMHNNIQIGRFVAYILA